MFCSKTAIFAYVSWFEDLFKDAETNLTYVHTATQTQSIIPVNNHFKTLVVSFDEEEPEKMWIISNS